MPNHVHLLLEKAPWDGLSALVGHLKGVTSRRLQQRFVGLRADLDSLRFWNRGFHYARHTEASLATVRAYIRNQRRASGLTDGPADGPPS